MALLRQYWFVIVLGLAAMQPALAADRLPNILLVMADQLDPQMTGPYGNREVKTPHMDRLAREGVLFTAAYTNCPLCAPARAALMAGRYASRIGVYDNANVFHDEVPTVAHHLRLAGYETVLSGKMHFVGADQLHGFERRLNADIYPADFRWTPRWQDKPVLNSGTPKAKAALQARIEEHPRQMEYDDGTEQKALAYFRDWLDTAAETRRPFFLTVSFSNPHAPAAVPKELWDLYEGVPISVAEVPGDMAPHESAMDRWINIFHGTDLFDLRDPEAMLRLRRVYYGQVTYIDRKLGALLDCLQAIGQLDSTVILFTADHGEMLGQRLMVEKRTFYEPSARVPLIAWWPQHWQGGLTRGEPVSLIDLFPTLVELAQAPPPIGIEGRSFLGLLEGRADVASPRVAISEYHGEGVIAPCWMIRQGDFKYVHIHGGDERLFNLREDPGEWHNLAGDPKYRNIGAGLRQQLLSQFDAVAIDRAVRLSQQRRLLMREAMNAGEPTRWDYQPEQAGAASDPSRDDGRSGG